MKNNNAKKLSEVLGPVLTVAVMTSLVTACSPSAPSDEGAASSSSSAPSAEMMDHDMDDMDHDMDDMDDEEEMDDEDDKNEEEMDGEETDKEDDAAASSTSSASSASEASSSSSQEAAASENKYEDGTFTAVGEYRSPGGSESVNVSVTIENDTVASATYQGTAEGGKSKLMQEAFGEGYSAMVVGKSIDEVSLDVVNGSSLTPKGFMDALEKIKLEASAS